MSLAIIALLASVLIGGAAHLLSEEPATVNDVFWKSVQEARKAALKSEHEVRLKFDKEKKQFVLLDGLAPSTLAADGVTLEERPLKTFPLPVTAAGSFTVELLGPSAKGANLNLIGGVLLETQPLAYATFYSDGTCSAFRVQFSRGGGASILAVDPWTCAPVITPSDPNSLPGN